MAAYAALVSVMHIIEQLEHHPRPPISLDKKQVASLTRNVIFLQEFLESYAPTGEYEGDGLESRILDAAYAAEDVIESHIVDRIHAGSTSEGDVEFSRLLQQVIENMDSIRNEVMRNKGKMGIQHQLQRKSTSSSGLKQNTTMVGFDDVLLELLDKLTGGGGLKIISIIGMGGIGKTTLARNVYEHPLIKEHFYIRAWVTISQVYHAREILRELLYKASIGYYVSRGNENKLGDKLYKLLSGQRYFIVMDDIWTIEAWETIRCFLPDNNNGSRIVMTTRLSNLVRSDHSLHMRFLDFNESWNLFNQIVFTRENGYPPEIMEIGKKIIENCRGLSLSIVVVGGFLAKSDYKRECWEAIEENLSSFVNSDNDELCLKILRLSYNQLTVHLRPCFLYMGMFKEDSEIPISKLVKLWVAEGFLKPINGKVLEEVAREYLHDVVDRNLVFIVKSRGKCVKIYDLLRDLCWRQAKAERFYRVVTQHSVNIPHDQRRFIVSRAPLQEVVADLQSMSLPRSIVTYDWRSYIASSYWNYISRKHRLLRISGTCANGLSIDNYFHENEFQLVNLRYLVIGFLPWESRFSTSYHLLWTLQTLIFRGVNNFFALDEIWNMPQLRHIQLESGLLLPDPPGWNGQDDIVLENLQTLELVFNFKCSEEVVKRIPNIKKLSVKYIEDLFKEPFLDNLDRLHELKSFKCISYSKHQPDMNISFPHSLKKLELECTQAHWQDLLEGIGSLPFLQKLKLIKGYFRNRTWETVEGHFPSLEFLKIAGCRDLEHWNLESSHFPRLQHLVLSELKVLNEIPSDIGEIPTLQLIELYHCNESTIMSCKTIQDEQDELYGGGEEVALRSRVHVYRSKYEALQHLATPNFEVVRSERA